MHIAIVTGSYHGLSGVSVHVQDLSNHLRKADQRVTVFAPDVRPEDSIENLRFVRIRDFPFIPQILFYLAELFRQHRRTKIDIVHIHDSIAFLAAYIFSKLSGVSTVFTFHASIFSGEQVVDYSWLSIQLYRFTNRFVARRAGKLICVNQEMMRCAQYAGADEVKVVIIPNLLDLSIFRPAIQRNYRPVCLYVGALRPAKGVRYLLQALPEVLKRIPDLTLQIVGGGPERQSLEIMSKELGIEDVVLFIGRIGRENLVPYYQQSSIFVTPTLREAQPIVILEAMACGLPIVASAVGGIPEMVFNGRNGLLVPPRDPPSLGDAILRLLTDNEMYRQCSTNAVKMASEFSWEQNIDRFVTLFQNLSMN